MKERFFKQMEPLERVVEQFPWADRKAYAWFVSQTYHYVRHSTRLLALSAGRFGVDKDPLHKRFIEHIREEKNHERLASNDLKHLGLELKDFPELPVTRAFYEPQYYKIEFESPLVLMGYILALEGISVRKMGTVYSILVRAHGEGASSFIKLHAAEDIDHVEKAFAQLNSATSTELSAIERNFTQSCELYGQILRKSQELAGLAAA